MSTSTLYWINMLETIGECRSTSASEFPTRESCGYLGGRGVSPSTSPDTSRPRDNVPVKRRAVPGSPSAHGTGATARGGSEDRSEVVKASCDSYKTQ